MRIADLNAQVVAAVAWAGLGSFLVWAGRDLGIGTLTEPQSGFLVFWGGAAVVAFALWVGIEAILASRPDGLASLWSGLRWGKVIIVVGLLVAYGALLSSLGFIPATLPLLLALLRVVDPVRWDLAAAVAVGATVGVWWVLERLLSIQLPKGVLGLG